MADYEVKRGANIGTASFILIFIVVCLATFGILSISNSNRENVLSQKNAASVVEYYRADSEGVAFLTQLSESMQGTRDGVMSQFGTYYQEDSGTFCTDVEMSGGRALRVELAPEWETKTLAVVSWNVYQKEEYEIDQDIPVWKGDES